jgi:HSP20 family protein
MKDNRVDLQTTDEAKAAAVLETTHAGPVYSPAVDIFETDRAITLLADLPGVRPDDLTVDLRDSVLTLTGRITTAEGPKEEVLLREHRSGTFLRQFSLAETIDQAKIDARLTDGVLRLELPKVEKAKPRQIAIHAN